MKSGKRYAEAMKNVDRSALYDVADAIALVKKNASAKFDETVEVHIRTGCDGRHADQQIRGEMCIRDSSWTSCSPAAARSAPGLSCPGEISSALTA